MNRYKMMFKLVFLIFALILVYVIGVIAYAWFTRYRPDEVEELEMLNSNYHTLKEDTVCIYTWNIAYAGLDKSSDFFYDGGKMMRPTQEQSERNFNGIRKEISTWKDADVIFLQELDVDAKRSWRTNQVESIVEQEFDKTSVFAKNYDVKFVPKPFFNPMGRVISGILTLSKWQPVSAQRFSYPANFPFPKGLFFLNRCFTVVKIPHQDKELVLINTHNSAFDGGVLKEKEMHFLKKYLLEEYAQGNYVVVGGDWNQIPPGFQGNRFAEYEEISVPENYPAKSWKWVADLNGKSNRKVDTPYIKGATYTTILDFFLISPNVEFVGVSTLKLDFKYSDHNPVKLILRLL